MAGGAAERTFSMKFRDELRHAEPRWLVHKYIISGDCRTLAAESYHELRAEIADWFGIHVNDVVMVGSGKLGFSLDPKQAFKEFHPMFRTSGRQFLRISSPLG